MTTASVFLDRLGIEPGVTWDDIVRVSEGLFGRPIYFIADHTADMRWRTGLWVATREFGLVITRARDDEHYRLVSQLHEISHVLTSYCAEGLVESLIGSSVSVRSDGSVARVCGSDEAHATPAERMVERFVEDVALELEHLMRAPASALEVHL